MRRVRLINRGFTLLEVMVALALSGLVLLGFGSIMKSQTETALHLEYRLAAEQATRNAIALLCVDPEGLKGVGEEKQSEGSESVGGWTWSWQRTVTIEKTENDEGEEEDRALRVNVVVGQEGEPVHRQELYLPLNLLSNGIPCQS